MRVLALSGSLRRGSHNTQLLRGATAAAPRGVEVVVYDGLKAVPPYDADDDQGPEEHPEAVRALREALAGADAVVVATPEYNSSIPGVLKNAFDWVSRPLASSPVRNVPVVVTADGTGGQEELVLGQDWLQHRKVWLSFGGRRVFLARAGE